MQGALRERREGADLLDGVAEELDAKRLSSRRREHVDEPAADLSVVAAVASSVRNRGLAPSTAVFGEVGLSGEIRGIPQAALRVKEAAQMGFSRVVLPAGNLDPADNTQADGRCELVGVRTVGEALDQLIA